MIFVVHDRDCFQTVLLLYSLLGIGPPDQLSFLPIVFLWFSRAIGFLCWVLGWSFGFLLSGHFERWAEQVLSEGQTSRSEAELSVAVGLRWLSSVISECPFQNPTRLIPCWFVIHCPPLGLSLAGSNLHSHSFTNASFVPRTFNSMFPFHFDGILVQNHVNTGDWVEAVPSTLVIPGPWIPVTSGHQARSWRWVHSLSTVD